MRGDMGRAGAERKPSAAGHKRLSDFLPIGYRAGSFFHVSQF
ncbi:hypothetical protein [Sphingobium sp. CR28]